MNRFLFGVFALVVVGWNTAAAFDGDRHVEVELLADIDRVEAGTPFRLGVKLAMEKDWHTYWAFGGDAGQPTEVEWGLPPGFSAGPLEWPAPHKYIEQGELVTYGYADEVMLTTQIRPPDRLEPGAILAFVAQVSWLECRELCIPGEDTVELTLAEGSGQPDNIALFDHYRARIPQVLTADDPVELNHKVGYSGAKLEIDLVLSGKEQSLVVGDGAPDFYPLSTAPLSIDEVIFSPPQQKAQAGVQRQSVGLALQLEPLGDDPVGQLSGLLVYRLEGEEALQFRQVSLEFEPQAGVAPQASPEVDLLEMSFDTGEEAVAVWVYFLWAAIGGLILNLMPCVLPVISLKVMGFVGQAGQERGRIRQLGFAFVAGIVVTFLLLALAVVALKAGGEQVGWGFQFQEPGFVIFMAGLVFLLGLSLFGVYEILLPGMGGNNEGEGLSASFFNGVLATVLATPCTAPFLGTALGFAFSQSAFLIIAIFFAIGVGMGLPYILLALQPGWMRFIPKPGAWMVQFKQAMGFLLMATVLWLLWVLGKQLGMEAVIWTGAFLLCLGLGGWIVGQWIDLRSGRSRRLTVWGIALGIGIGAYLVLVAPLMEEVEATQKASPDGEELVWLPFSVPAVERLIGDGNTVFIDFTAEWCWTCKVNERTVLADPEVKARFDELEVKLVKADWTSKDPDITALLQKFGRSGVPLYVIFSGGRAEAPLVLPEVITKAIVLEKLAESVQN